MQYVRVVLKIIKGLKAVAFLPITQIIDKSYDTKDSH